MVSGLLAMGGAMGGTMAPPWMVPTVGAALHPGPLTRAGESRGRWCSIGRKTEAAWDTRSDKFGE